jgi:rubrerythrin
MNENHDEIRRLFTHSSLANIVYRTWARQARHERRFNIARLFEALSAARGARAEHTFQQLGEIGTTPWNIERALNGLEPDAIATGPITGTSAVSRDLLLRASRACNEHRDLRADELGDLFVCSTCGEIREGKLEGACARCGAVPEAHKAFKAIDAMGTLGPHAIMSFLEQSEAGLQKLVDGLSEELLSTHPSNNQPSLKELVGHLADVDRIFRERAWLLLETEKPELPPGHPPTLHSAAVYRRQPIAQVLKAYHEARTDTLKLMRGLTSAAWHRPGYHELYGEINLLHQGNWVINHERSHLVEMAQIRHDLIKSHQVSTPEAQVTEVVIGVNEGE